MSIADSVTQTVQALSPEQQQKVLEYAQFLQQAQSTHESGFHKKSDWCDHPFIGMWKDREDIQDSVEWVRQIRKNEWRDR